MSTAPEEIKSKLDIVELVGEYVQLQKGSANSMKALCPFHGEKTPSFYVHRDKQFFHCFGCGESGDIFSFYQKIENVEFLDALKELASKAGVRLPDYDPKKQSERAAILAVLEDAAKFYEAALGHDIGKRGRAYLEKRGLNAETIKEFGIGYAPNGWENLMKALTKKGHKAQKIVAAGLAIPSEKRKDPYDRFRDRIMVPIRDEKGIVVGFTGRILPDNPDADKTGKYINTPETRVYHKRKLVFGLDMAKEHIKAGNFAVLVEGQMDAISSHAAGVKNVVAVSGTAFSEEQIDLLKRYCGRIAMAFDADVAGQNALSKALPHAWKNGLQVLVVTLSDDCKDPDEVIQKDPALWKKAIETAQDMVEYSVNHAMASVAPTDPFSKKRALESLKPIFALLADPVLHAHWVHVLSSKLDLAEGAIRNELRAGAVTPPKPLHEKRPVQQREPRKRGREEKLCERYLSLILNHPDRYLAKISEFDVRWAPEGYLEGLVKKLKDQYTKTQNNLLTQKEVFSWFEDVRKQYPEMPPAQALVMLKERDMVGWTEEQLDQEIDACALELSKLAKKRWIKELIAALAEAERGGDAERAAKIAKRLEELTKMQA